MSAIPPTVHATALILGAAGVLVRGAPGSGKSTLAMALVRRWTGAGRFAAFVADDRVILENAGRRLVARTPDPLAGLAELAGRGILNVDHEPAAVIRLVVDLVPAETLARMADPRDLSASVAGVVLLRQPVPARSTLAASLLVEGALDGVTGPANAPLVP